VKICKPEYLEKALLLSVEEQERLLSRMTGKLPRRLEKDKLSVDEALAIQLEMEDEQLNEWREKMHAMKAAGKPVPLPRTAAKPKAAVKTKTATKKPTVAKPAKASAVQAEKAAAVASKKIPKKSKPA
jgi:polyhydroxyalkanoate synthesis regulator protein